MKTAANHLGACSGAAVIGAEAASIMDETGKFRFDDAYAKKAPDQLPWHCATLDPDFANALDQRGIRSGRAVDVGAGTGTQAVALAKLGLEVWGTDDSPSAARLAARLAEEQGVPARFVVDDVCDTRLPGGFDLVLDRGCLHVIQPEMRAGYMASLSRLLRPGGLMLLKCLSVDEPPHPGPFRFAEEDIRELFSQGFALLECRKTIFHSPLPVQPLAVFAVLQRV